MDLRRQAMHGQCSKSAWSLQAAECRDAAPSLRQLVSRKTTEPLRLRGAWNLDRHATQIQATPASDLGVIRLRAEVAWELRGLADQNPATRTDYRPLVSLERQQSPQITVH